jgi:hypothetical protein
MTAFRATIALLPYLRRYQRKRAELSPGRRPQTLSSLPVGVSVLDKENVIFSNQLFRIIHLDPEKSPLIDIEKTYLRLTSGFRATSSSAQAARKGRW